MTESSNHGRPLPPVETRWKKGISGNPRGRPKKEASLTALLKAESRRICPADPQNRSWEDLLVRSMLQSALKGNATALKQVCERLDSKDSTSRLTSAEAVAMIDELYGLNQD